MLRSGGESKIVCLNHERKISENSEFDSTLTQERIDKTFSKSQRVSNSYFLFNKYNIQMLNGKGTGNLGVIKSLQSGQYFEYTDIERTLIDIAVRPMYAGGVSEVLEAYKKARGRVEVKKLAKYLEKIDFIYPYHQVIGFYLERAGYTESDFTQFAKEMDYKFYLTYNIPNKIFSQKWQLYYPSELK